MTTRHRRPLALVAALSLLAIPPALAADGPEDGTIALFDGESLEGWEAVDFYKPGPVTVEDGAIVLGLSEASAGMTGIVTTRDDLPTTDYELTFEARRLAGHDFFAAATFPVGDDFLTLVNGGWGGSVTGLSSIDGADASENSTGTYKKYEDETWYTFRIRVTAAGVRCSVDDEEIVAFNPRKRQLGTRLESRRCEPLGFATWETSGAIRSIALRRLTPEEVRENAVNVGL